MSTTTTTVVAVRPELCEQAQSACRSAVSTIKNKAIAIRETFLQAMQDAGLEPGEPTAERGDIITSVRNQLFGIYASKSAIRKHVFHKDALKNQEFQRAAETLATHISRMCSELGYAIKAGTVAAKPVAATAKPDSTMEAEAEPAKAKADTRPARLADKSNEELIQLLKAEGLTGKRLRVLAKGLDQLTKSEPTKATDSVEPVKAGK